MAGIPASISPTEEDLTPVAGQGRLSTVDNRTLYGTPAPLAASTVNRPHRNFDRVLAAGGQGSFLEGGSSTYSNPPGVDDLGLVKLSLSGFDSTRSNADRHKFGLDSLKFSGSTSSHPDQTSGLGPNRSSMGLIPVDDMLDLSSSLLHFDASLPKPDRKGQVEKSLSRKGELSGKDASGTKSQSWRKDLTNNINSGMSPPVTTSAPVGIKQTGGSAAPKSNSVKMVSSDKSQNAPFNNTSWTGRQIVSSSGAAQEIRTNNQGSSAASVSMGQTPRPTRPELGLDVMAGGMTFGGQSQEDGEMSVHEVEFGEDELKQFDDEFSDIGELTLTGDLTVTDDVSEAEELHDDPDVLPGQQGLGNWPQGGNPFQYDEFGNALNASRFKLGERGEASGQRSDEGELLFRHSEGEGQEDSGRNHRIFNYSSGAHGTSQPTGNLSRQTYHQIQHPHEVGDGEEEDGSPAHRLSASRLAEEELANLQFEHYEEHFQRMAERPVRPVENSDLDTDDEIEAVQRENYQRANGFNDAPRSRDFRPGLEGVSFEYAGVRQSAEGDVVSSPVPGDGGGGGDGSSGHSSDDDGGIASQFPSVNMLQANQNSTRSGVGSRPSHDDPRAHARLRPQGDDLSHPVQSMPRQVRFASPADFRDRTLSGASFDDDTADFSRPQGSYGKGGSQPFRLGSQFLQATPNSRPSISLGRGLDSGAFELGDDGSIISEGESDQALFPDEDEGGEPADITFSGKVSFGDAGEFSMLQPCTSPMSDGNRNSHESRTSREGLQDMTTAQDTSGRQYLSDKSPVYLNEEGEYVTDLAYYTDFASAPNPFDTTAPSLNFGASLGASMGVDLGSDVDIPCDEDFITGDQGLAMIDMDQEKFEQENVITQDDAMVPGASTPNSWTVHSTIDLAHPSWQDSDEDTRAYMRISIGAFMRARTEALGCLEGDEGGNTPHVRPNFGTQIVTPPDNLPPVRLLPQSSPSFEEGQHRKAPSSDDVRGPGVGSDVDAEVGDRPMLASDLELSPTKPMAKDNQKDQVAETGKNNHSTHAPVNQVETPVRPLQNGSNAPLEQFMYEERPETPGSVTDTETSSSNSTTDNESDVSSNRSSNDGVNLSAITRYITSASATVNPDELADVIMKMSLKPPGPSKSGHKKGKPVQKARGSELPSRPSDQASKSLGEKALPRASDQVKSGCSERPLSRPSKQAANPSQQDLHRPFQQVFQNHAGQDKAQDSPSGDHPVTVVRNSKIPGQERQEKASSLSKGYRDSSSGQKNERSRVDQYNNNVQNWNKSPLASQPASGAPVQRLQFQNHVSPTAPKLQSDVGRMDGKMVNLKTQIHSDMNLGLATETSQVNFVDNDEIFGDKWNSPRPSLLMSQRREQGYVDPSELGREVENFENVMTGKTLTKHLNEALTRANKQTGLPRHDPTVPVRDMHETGTDTAHDLREKEQWAHSRGAKNHENSEDIQKTPSSDPAQLQARKNRFSSTPSRPDDHQNFTIQSSRECLSHISPNDMQYITESEGNSLWVDDDPTPRNVPQHSSQYFEGRQEQVTPKQSPQRPQRSSQYSGVQVSGIQPADPVNQMYFNNQLQTARARQANTSTNVSQNSRLYHTENARQTQMSLNQEQLPSPHQTVPNIQLQAPVSRGPISTQHSQIPVESWKHKLLPNNSRSSVPSGTGVPTLLTTQTLSTTAPAAQYQHSHTVTGVPQFSRPVSSAAYIPHNKAQASSVNTGDFHSGIRGLPHIATTHLSRRDTAISEGSIAEDTTMNISPDQRLSDIGCPSHHSTMQSQYRSSPVERTTKPAYTYVTPSSHHYGSRPVTSVAETNWSPLAHHTSPTHIPHHKDYNPKDIHVNKFVQDVGMRVSLPQEVRVKEVCCVGLSASASLPLHNPSTRWLHVGLQVVQVCIDGQAQDTDRCVPFVMKEKVIIEPGTTEDVKVIFAPRQAGVFVAKLHIFSSPVVADQSIETAQVPSMVTLQAIAEQPNVQVLTDGARCLDFGALPWGCQKAMPIVLFNCGRAMVPVRLAITSHKGSWHCFSFEKQTSSNASVISGFARPSSPSLAPSVVNYSLPPMDEVPQPVNVVVYFKAPTKQPELILPTHPEEFSACIDVQIDTPTCQGSLSTLDLRAAVGTARLHAPQNREVISFKAEINRSDSSLLPLRNAGNIPLEVSLEVTHWPDFFSVQPSHVIIQPSGQAELNITFQPKQATAKKFDSLLLMYVEPDGPGYEIDLRGEVCLPQPLAAPPKRKGPLLLSNKHYLAWGGIAVGHALQQSLTLKNNADKVLKLTLEIRGRTEDFQFQSTFGKHDKLTKEVILKPKEEYPVQVLFAPSRVAVAEGRLTVRAVQEQTKYTIPLTAYGGISQLEVEQLPTGQSGNYWTSIGPIHPGSHATVKATLRNTGSRTAFIKAMSFQDLGCKKHFSSSGMTVQPMEFCLKPHESQAVVVTLNPSEREAALCMHKNSVVSSVAFFYGDELSRWKLRRALGKSREQPIALGKENPVRDVDFTAHFLGEDLACEDVAVRASPHDVELFYSTMRKTQLALVGEAPPPPPPNPPTLYQDTSGFGELPRVGNQFSSYQMRSPKSQQHSISMTGQTPPVKGTPAAQLTKTCPTPDVTHKPPPSKKLFSTQGNLERKLANAHGYDAPGSDKEHEGWEIKPKNVIVIAPKPNCDLMMKKVQIINYSDRPVTFELSWPAHIITACPEQGTIPPRSITGISISANSSMRSKVQLPWQGRILVWSDNQSKELGVQVREDVAMDDTVTSAMTPRIGLREDLSTTPLITKPGGHQSALLQVNCDKLVFPSTTIGHKQELHLELTNITLDPVKWVISSFASAYIKKLHEGSSGNVLRATYVVFYLPSQAGVLQAKETVKVPVSFSPVEACAYSQYWEVRSECPTSATSAQHIFKIEFTGEGTSEKGNGTRHLGTSGTPAEVLAAGSGHRTGKPKPTGCQRILLTTDAVQFPVTHPHERAVVKMELKNKDREPHVIKLATLDPPFYMPQESAVIKSRHFLRLPVHFKPERPGSYKGRVVLQTETGYTLSATLKGECQ